MTGWLYGFVLLTLSIVAMPAYAQASVGVIASPPEMAVGPQGPPALCGATSLKGERLDTYYSLHLSARAGANGSESDSTDAPLPTRSDTLIALMPVQEVAGEAWPSPN